MRPLPAFGSSLRLLAETRGYGDYRYRISARGEPRRAGSALYLDKDGGPTMDDLSRVSRELSDLLDTHDVVEAAYTLEVSSPGINRPLKLPEHFARFIGKTVRVRTRELIHGRTVISRPASGSLER